MSMLFSLSVKISVLLIIALGLLPLLRRRSAAFRHGVLMITVVCAIALPVLEAVVPSWSIALPNRRGEQLHAIGTDAVGAVQPSVLTSPIRGAASSARSRAWLLPPAEALEQVGVTTWGVGVGLSLLALLIGLGRLSWLAHRATAIADPMWTRVLSDVTRGFDLRRPVRLLRSPHPTLLAVWGWRAPTVIVPPSAQQWSEERVRIVLSHELAHVWRGDWNSQLITELLVAACWFNPLVWMLRGRLRLESEHACDDAVLERGWTAADYATHLMDLARAFRVSRHTAVGLPASAMARPAGLERRVSAMLQADFDRRPLTRSNRVVLVAALLAVTCAIAGAVVTAQTISSVVGTILDPTDRVLPDVRVVLTNTVSQAKYEVRTDGNGRFELAGVPDGDYAYEMSLLGFSTLTGTMKVAGNGKVETRATMQVGTLEENIVTAASGRPGPPRPPAGPPQTWAFEPATVPECPASTAVGGNIRAPKKVRNVPPIYPESLNLAQVSGRVELDAIIGPDGAVQEVRTVSATHPEFERAAAEAVSEWKFTTTFLNCQPIAVAMHVHLAFEIRPDLPERPRSDTLVRARTGLQPTG